MLAAAEAIERKLGIIVRPLSSDGPWLAANSRLQLDKFRDDQLAELAPIAPALYWLDLGETGVTDAGLKPLAAMKNLRRLQLDRTAITDTGLAHLAPLSHLESLSLHSTKITDTGLLALRALPRLRSLYLWQTGVTPAGLEKLVKAQTDQNKISRWKAQISELESNISAEQFRGNLGNLVQSASTVAVAMPPLNIPVEKSAEPIAALAATQGGKGIESVAASTPVANATCPVTGKAIDATVTETFEGKLIGFCCENCRDRFREEPAKYPLKTAARR
jgi:YHS domain-containing protein